MQDRITGFVAKHSHADQSDIEEMMMDTGFMTKDLGTILVGKEAVKAGVIDEVGGIKEAMGKLHGFIEKNKKKTNSKNNK